MPTRKDFLYLCHEVLFVDGKFERKQWFLVSILYIIFQCNVGILFKGLMIDRYSDKIIQPSLLILMINKLHSLF